MNLRVRLNLNLMKELRIGSERIRDFGIQSDRLLTGDAAGRSFQIWAR